MLGWFVIPGVHHGDTMDMGSFLLVILVEQLKTEQCQMSLVIILLKFSNKYHKTNSKLTNKTNLKNRRHKHNRISSKMIYIINNKTSNKTNNTLNPILLNNSSLKNGINKFQVQKTNKMSKLKLSKNNSSLIIMINNCKVVSNKL